MAGYWIVRGSEVEDRDAFERYAQRWGPISKKYGARMLAGRGRHQTREGQDHVRNLIIEFPSYESAVACYEDPAYQAALADVRKAYRRELTIVEGN